VGDPPPGYLSLQELKMYGVVEVSGHQYRVQAGDVIDVQKLNDEEGKTIKLDQVLFVGGDEPQVGTPLVKGAKVTAKVIRHDRSRKLLILKRKPGLYQKKKGHRQHFTSLLITELDNGAGKTDKIDAKSKNAEKYLK
jgi:large subunit ribosomal protein L21